VEERTTDGHDYRAQHRLLRQTVRDGFDGIALVPAHRERLNPEIREAMRKNVVIATFNTDAPQSERLFFVGQNLYHSGRVAGELLGGFVGRRGCVAIMTGFSWVWAHAERLRGFRDSIAEYYPDIRLIGPYEFADQVSRAETLTKHIVDEWASVVGLYSTAGSGHLGAGRALLERGLNGQIQNIGYDMNGEVRSLMGRDAIQASIGQAPFSQGYYVVKLLFDYLTHRTLPNDGVLHTKTEVLLRSTLEDLPLDQERYQRPAVMRSPAFES
jgi:ABC-type sugar transport system substrate-binding protein